MYTSLRPPYQTQVVGTSTILTWSYANAGVYGVGRENRAVSCSFSGDRLVSIPVTIGAGDSDVVQASNHLPPAAATPAALPDIIPDVAAEFQNLKVGDVVEIHRLDDSIISGSVATAGPSWVVVSVEKPQHREIVLESKMKALRRTPLMP